MSMNEIVIMDGNTLVGTVKITNPAYFDKAKMMALYPVFLKNTGEVIEYNAQML